MAKTAAWGGQVELLALSRLLNRPIEVREVRGGRGEIIIVISTGHTSGGSFNGDGGRYPRTVQLDIDLPQTHVWPGGTLQQCHQFITSDIITSSKSYFLLQNITRIGYLISEYRVRY